MDKEQFKLALSQKLKAGLPGYEAQRLMEPPMRNTFELDSSKAKKAATVLILYFEEEWKFILIRRSSHPLDKHKGQIGFPGGSIEKGEKANDAAIREANEEIGISSDKFELVGKLSDLFIPVSNFLVMPYVAFGEVKIDELIKEEAEVDEIISIKLNDLLDSNRVQKKSMRMANGMNINDIPYFDIDGLEIWGATAMMLSEFREIVKGM